MNSSKLSTMTIVELDLIKNCFQSKSNWAKSIDKTPSCIGMWYSNLNISHDGLKRLANHFNNLGSVSPEVRVLIESKLGQSMESVELEVKPKKELKVLQGHDLTKLVEAIEAQGWKVELSRAKVA